MTKSAGTATEANNDDVSPSWGTWEELLLAFAVNRHGTGAWDSIAAELRKRSSDPSVTLTAQNCRLKYLDLRRRYVAPADDLEDASLDEKSNDEDSLSLLEELRKLRVAELRREVERYDLNIESLESKMKRMEEERERREKNESDLEKNEKRETEPESEPASDGQPATGEESEKDQMSVNESNSTDLGAERVGTGDNDKEPARTGRTVAEPSELGSEPGKKLVREDSCNGSSNSLEKESNRKATAEAVRDSAELVESEAESKGGEAEAAKDNSDVQSSASRSMEEKEGKDKVRRGNTSSDEREHEDQSRTVKELSAESHRLIDFLRAIRAHKFGSMFERRLRSQESSKYQKLILQHVDLETIETRLNEGCYKGSKTKLFRDLLLLVNNALVFFNKNSSEAKAAIEVRHLVSKEMSQKSAKSDSSSGKQASLQSLSKPRKDELLFKPAIPNPIIACRKRSSIAAKASNSSDKKKEQLPLLEKDKDTTKLQNSSNSEEPKFAKKRTRDRISPVPAKKNGKTQPKNKSAAETGKQAVKGGSTSHSESKIENKKNQSMVDSKKRGASNFLNRLNKSSSSNNGLLAEEVKNMPLTTSESSKRGEKREQVTRRSSETRQGKEKGSPDKKNVGRPPKRGAAPPPPPPVLGKRGRDRGEAAESGGSKQQPKKRTRKV